MKRRLVVFVGLMGLLAMLLQGTAASGLARSSAIVSDPGAAPLCEARVPLCPETYTHVSYEGQYVGHDEPSLLFYSDVPGSGNATTYRLRLPHEAPTMPTQDGTGGTWNFQLHPAFWFGMALCESESFPNPGVPCTPNSDANIADNPDPTAPDWVGNHVGSGFLELQFYPPGWSSAVSCDPTRWCVAMVVFGLSDSITQTNNLDCLQSAGEEWANFAYLTLNGKPHAPPSPLEATGDTFTANPATDLLMGQGDNLVVRVHDSERGLVTKVVDKTTNQIGSMKASTANGFAHPLFQPDASTCTQAPYAFHPMYSTSSEHTRVSWAAHSYNVAFSDEIGHFEYCNTVDPTTGACTSAGVHDPEVDPDDEFCLDASSSLLVQVSGCLSFNVLDTDFDGESYQPGWPGSNPDPTVDAALHSQSFVFSSPRIGDDVKGGANYSRVAFEADMPAIEPACDGLTGVGCTNPPPGAVFYPIYSTRGTTNSCAWQEGGVYIPGTTNTFGGSSVSEYGSAFTLAYPAGPGATVLAFEDVRNILGTNPCLAHQQLPA